MYKITILVYKMKVIFSKMYSQWLFGFWIYSYFMDMTCLHNFLFLFLKVLNLFIFLKCLSNFIIKKNDFHNLIEKKKHFNLIFYFLFKKWTLKFCLRNNFSFFTTLSRRKELYLAFITKLFSQILGKKKYLNSILFEKKVIHNFIYL